MLLESFLDELKKRSEKIECGPWYRCTYFENILKEVSCLPEVQQILQRELEYLKSLNNTINQQ